MWVHYSSNLNSVSCEGCPPHPSPAPWSSYYPSVEIWKLLTTCRIDWAFADWILYIAAKSPTSCTVIAVLPSNVKNISLCRINMGGQWWGAKERRCWRKYSNRHQPVWLTDRSIGISKFSPGKGTPQLFMAQSLLDGHLWLISEQVIM